MISVHVEVLPHLHRTVHAIKALGVKAGVVLNPSTPVVALEEIAGDVDFVLVMSVNPGFGGQTFIPRSESKSARGPRAARSQRQRRARSRSTAASTPRNIAPRSSRPAPRILVAGSAVFGTPRSRARHARAARPRRRPAARRVTRRRSRGDAPTRRRRACACATPKPTRWASSTTRTTSSGSRSAGPTCCATLGWTLSGDGSRRVCRCR